MTERSAQPLMDTASLLEALRSEFEASPCAHIYPDATNTVWMRGSSDPDIVFVGEAPGREEDLQGIPFVGPSGKLLDTWCEYLAIEDYAIVNVMKTRPPNNRNPTPEEVASCAPWLDRQLAILKPRIIVCLGSFAMKHFMPKRTAVLTNTKRLLDGRYVVVPHPSYFLRKGGVGWEEYIEPLRGFLQGGQRRLSDGIK
jgi:uracil-DNA glycosylase